MCRNVLKLFQTKQYYRKLNLMMLFSPYLHRRAILEGLLSEGISLLVEDLIRVQLDRLERPHITDELEQEILSLTDSVRYAHSNSEYTMEAFVNMKLGWTVRTLLDLIARDVICGSRQITGPSPRTIPDKCEDVSSCI